MLTEENNEFDQEWITLIKEAYHLGLSVEEVKEFIYSIHQEPIVK
ncbi:anti-repressor SinI family protein [Priestia megaterium]|nr:anti-repressor SinI family protein [Priestia megaterium]